MRVDHEITINRPVAEVFAYITDVDNLITWQESCLEVNREDDAPLVVGARWTEVREVMSRTMEQSVEVEALEQDRLFTIRSLSGPVRLRVEHWLERRDGSTYLHVVGEADLGGFSRLGAPMVRRQARRMFESDFARLKRALEAR